MRAPGSGRGRGIPDNPIPGETARDEESHGIKVHLDVLLEARGMTLAELARRVGVTVVNLSVLKNDRARAVRFTTLSAVCRELECQPGDLLSFDPSA